MNNIETKTAISQQACVVLQTHPCVYHLASILLVEALQCELLISLLCPRPLQVTVTRVLIFWKRSCLAED